MNGAATILQVEDVSVSFGANAPRVLNGVSLQLAAGKVLAIVGESGSGKTLLARSIIGLLPPGAMVRSGRVELLGQDLTGLPGAAMRKLRGDQVSMIFQEPQVSLNPVVRIGRQLTEAAIERRVLTPDAARRRALDLLERVKIPDPADVMKRYPHELSGGMRKRAGLARALALDADILFLDEPTAGLDPIGAANFDSLIGDLQRALGLTVVMVTHDLDSLYAICDRVSVLVDKRVKVGTIEDLMREPDPWIQEYFGGPRGRAAASSAARAGESAAPEQAAPEQGA